MAGASTNLGLILPVVTDATIVRDIYNTNWETIDAGVQMLDAGLTSIAALTTAANKMIYTTALDTYAVASLSAFARTILDDADEATFKATVNLEIGTDVLAQQTIGIANDNLIEIDHASVADNDYAKFTTVGLEGRSYSEVKTDLSLNSVENTAISTWAGSTNITTLGTIATGTWSATTIAIAKGGTGVTTGAMTGLTSILNTALYVGRNADNQIKFATDNTILFRLAGVDGAAFISTGELDMNAHSVGFTLQTTTGDGTTTIDWRLGLKFRFTFGAQADTLTFTAPSNPCNLMLMVKQDSTGSRDLTFPGTVIWLGDEPTWTDGGANKSLAVAIFYDGTTYWCTGSAWEV